MEALKASTQHEKRYMEVALAALQRRLVKALMAEHLQKKQSREADRARSRPAAASMEAADKVGVLWFKIHNPCIACFLTPNWGCTAPV